MINDCDSILRRFERATLLVLIPLIPVIFVFYFICGDSRLLTSIPIILTITALIQLEITGLFGYMDELEDELSDKYEESGITPSHITRKLYEFYDPERPKWDFIKHHLYRNKRVGFVFGLCAGLFQLFRIWFI